MIGGVEAMHQFYCGGCVAFFYSAESGEDKKCPECGRITFINISEKQKKMIDNTYKIMGIQKRRKYEEVIGVF